MSVISANLATILTADAEGYVRAFGGANAATERLVKSTQDLSKHAGKLNEFIKQNRTLRDVAKNTVEAISNINPVTALAVTGLGLMGGAMVKATHDAIGLAAELNTISRRTGETVETISALKFAAEQENASLGDVSAGLRFLARSTNAANEQNKEAVKVFKDLDVELKDAAGRARPLGAIFEDVAESISRIPDPARRTAVAAQLLGKNSGPALVPLLTRGREGLREYREEAERLGLIISTRFAQQADAFQTKLSTLRQVSIGFGASIGEAVIPSLNALLDELTNIIAPGESFKTLMGDIGFILFGFTQRLILGAQATSLFFAEFGPKNLGRLLAGRERTKELQKELDNLRTRLHETARQANLTREEYDKLGEETKEVSEETGGAKDALTALAEEFKLLTDEGIAPFVALAREFASSAFGPFDERLLALIERLDGMAASSDKARKALVGVISVQSQASDEFFGPRPGPRGLTTRGVQGPATSGGESPSGFLIPDQAAPIPLIEPLTDTEEAFFQAEEAARSFFETTVDLSAQAFQAMDGFASGFADALTSGADLAKIRFGEFFKNLLRDLARSIARALILRAVLSAFNFTGIGPALRSLQSALRLGDFSFQDRESSILGQASAARSMAVRPSSVALAPQPLAAGAGGMEVRIMEPGPLTWAEIVDKKIGPRLHYRRDHLNERSF